MKKIFAVLPGYEDVLALWFKERHIQTKLYAVDGENLYFGVEKITPELLVKMNEMNYISREYSDLEELLQDIKMNAEAENER